MTIKHWIPIGSIVVVAVAFILAASLAGGEKGGPPSDDWGPPISVDAEAEKLLPTSEGEDLGNPGPGPGITIRGKFVPIPAEAIIIGPAIGDGPGVHPEPAITVQYRNSRVTFRASDGVALERAVDRADEQALGALLGALRP